MAKQKLSLPDGTPITPFGGGEGGTPRKRKCPLTKKELTSNIRSLLVTLEGANGELPTKRQFVAMPKQFSTGSVGWNVNDKVVVLLDGKEVVCQVGLNITVVGSKEASEE